LACFQKKREEEEEEVNPTTINLSFNASRNQLKSGISRTKMQFPENVSVNSSMFKYIEESHESNLEKSSMT